MIAITTSSPAPRNVSAFPSGSQRRLFAIYFGDNRERCSDAPGIARSDDFTCKRRIHVAAAS